MDLRHGDVKQSVATEIPFRAVAAITSRGHLRFSPKESGGVNADLSHRRSRPGASRQEDRGAR
jgi:hypothetical protein